ncbi:MAG: leucyl/phenylalanyl-tRNA--protein transferase [Bacteroidetes bacterium]|nr:leucyl/phenylalanyl-tRNA--protein transferase [Bacteroidota bacterium]
MTSGSKSIIPSVQLLNAYKIGLFPMADRNGKINWFEPKARAILPFENLKISRSLKAKIKKNIYEVTIDKSFKDVVQNCASRNETWISDEIIESYQNLFKLGFAHSIETRFNNELVGGLYGVSIGGAFYGESMFSKLTDASKIALVKLVEHLTLKKFILLDCQFITPHLKSLGAIEITKNEYIILLNKAIKLKTKFN